MRQQLTESEIDSYRRDGFVVIEELLSSHELDEWRAAVDDAIAERDTVLPEIDPASPDDRVGDAATYYAKVFTQRVNLWRTNARVRRLILDDRIGKLAATLSGSPAVRIWHDQALVKAPFANPTAFHLDVPYWSFSSSDAISIWIALDDATLQNGCLYFVPGSHRAASFDNVAIGPEIGALFDVYPDWRGVAPVPCPVRAGGCTFHNGLTFHGAGANMTPTPRRAMTAGFMPDGARFNGKQNILTPEQMAVLRVGDVLGDEVHNPIVYGAA